ncbi:MAG TPA: hypothetical protein VFR85_08660, partial [Anaeromyxobacteraceae bacterium]|nr:hypothetical protein [Anaeromyxobacteraceae bacterium]
MKVKEKALAWSQASFCAGAACLALALLAPSCTDSPAGSQDPLRGNPNAPVSNYPVVTGGTWVRGANLKDAMGRPQARQEHAAAVLNGFVYLIGGFVPIQPPPAPTENNPEPFPFVGTGEVLVYTPLGHPADPPGVPGQWVSLPQASSFPLPDAHHIVAVAHQGRIWALGGHSGPFSPTSGIYVFTPDSATSPAGTWQQVRASDGAPCGAGEQCFELPEARAAGAAVSVGDRIYLMGGVVFNSGSPDPVNQSIRSTDSVISLDTTRFPLRWEAAPSLHESREHFNAVVAAGRIWVFQGRSEQSTHMRGVESMSPGQGGWRPEENAPVGASANILALVGNRVFSFGGEFIASNITGTLISSQ